MEIISEASETISAPKLQEQALRHCIATSTCSVNREKQGKQVMGKAEKISLTATEAEGGTQGPSKDGKPSEAETAWLDAYTGYVEKQ